MSYRTYREIEGDDESGLMAQVIEQRARVGRRLASVERVVAIMSGKGGVGKSHVTARLAAGAATRGKAIGVLDADLRSPTVARLLEAEGPLAVTDDGVEPAVGRCGVRVVSTDLLLDEGQPLAWREPASERFVWRGVKEMGTFREFLGDMIWGPLDVLFVDLPPGADGVVDLKELVPDLTGALIVTIPSEESRRSVARTMRSAFDAGIPLLGVVENMSGYHCPECRGTRPLFTGTAGADLAEAFGVPLIGRLPFVPDDHVTSADRGGTDALVDDVLEMLR